MTNEKFYAIVVRNENGNIVQSIENKYISDLPGNDLLIRVCYSSINYKDCMSYMGNLGVTRRFPHTPGIDAAGIVVKSSDEKFNVGDEVLIVSRLMGMSSPGGFGQYITCPSSWVEHIPLGLTMRECMIFGTAGLTAACAIDKIEDSVKCPSDATVVVTGATGGVGLLSCAILVKLGYKVTSISGKINAELILNAVGVSDVIDRKLFIDSSDRNILSPKWDIAVDTVGGGILSTVIKHLNPDGRAYCAGIVSSQDLSVSLLPFVLRGVSLNGINMEGANSIYRKRLWSNLSKAWRPDCLSSLAVEIEIGDIDMAVKKILSGNNSGRIVVNLT